MNYDLYIRIGGVILTCLCWYCDSNKIKIWIKLHKDKYEYLMGIWSWGCSPISLFDEWCDCHAWNHTEKEIKEKFKYYYKSLINNNIYKDAPDYIQKLAREKIIKVLKDYI